MGVALINTYRRPCIKWADCLRSSDSDGSTQRCRDDGGRGCNPHFEAVQVKHAKVQSCNQSISRLVNLSAVPEMAPLMYWTVQPTCSTGLTGSTEAKLF